MSWSTAYEPFLTPAWISPIWTQLLSTLCRKGKSESNKIVSVQLLEWVGLLSGSVFARNAVVRLGAAETACVRPTLYPLLADTWESEQTTKSVCTRTLEYCIHSVRLG